MASGGIKLYNVVLMYDLYIVAKSKEEAVTVARSLTATEPPTDQTTYDNLARPSDIMASWRAQKPFVANSVTEAEYKPYEGATTAEFLIRFLEKR